MTPRARSSGSKATDSISLVNGYGIGAFELASLQTLRDRANSSGVASGRLQAKVVRGDVREIHHAPEYQGALVQVASRFALGDAQKLSLHVWFRGEIL